MGHVVAFETQYVRAAVREVVRRGASHPADAHDDGVVAAVLGSLGSRFVVHVRTNTRLGPKFRRFGQYPDVRGYWAGGVTETEVGWGTTWRERGDRLEPIRSGTARHRTPTPPRVSRLPSSATADAAAVRRKTVLLASLSPKIGDFRDDEGVALEPCGRATSEPSVAPLRDTSRRAQNRAPARAGEAEPSANQFHAGPPCESLNPRTGRTRPMH
ncbi:hypothetical protein [Halorussus caseinilyticus]|uniref:Uncharacterized protein n=1 Tax=Halorussus caseinilyticus TaxID=3034025 RepID=A0ABD5WKI0_9EURY